MDKEKFKEIPTGTGRESEPKETLPVIEVDNEVIWVNENFEEIPLKLKEGEPTKLGLFLTPKPKEGEKTVDLKVSEEHGRSALLGRAIFKDKQERLYRDIDLKGMGRVAGIEAKVGDLWGGRGIFDLEDALNNKNMAEKFLKAGIRTERYLALIKLKEIIDKNGQKTSIKEAKKRRLIPSEEQPVIALRAFGTKFRVSDINKERLEDARQLVAQELNIKKEKFSWEDYLKWFAKTAGRNLGLMHKNEWLHEYLTVHNVTLDCRVVDLDEVHSFHKMKEEDKREGMEFDYQELKRTLLDLIKPGAANYTKWQMDKYLSYTQKKQVENLQNIFDDAYKKTLGYTPKFLTKEE